MSTSHLVVLPTSSATSPAERLRRLQSEARSVASEHLGELSSTLSALTRLSGEIADGGELYPVGARDLSRRLAHESAKHALTLTAILERG